VRLFVDRSHLRGSPTLGERARVKRGLWSNAFLDTLRHDRRQPHAAGTRPAKQVPFFGRDFREFLVEKQAFLKTLHSKVFRYEEAVKTLFLYLNVLKTVSNLGVTWTSSPDTRRAEI
jgi:hypothetical protein